MTLSLVTEAKKVLLMSWSARFGVLAAVLQALAEFQDQLPLIKDYVPHGVFSLLAIACAIAVPLSRIVKQQGLIDAIAAAQPAAADPAVAPADPAAPVADPVAAVQLNAHNAPPPPPTPVTPPSVVTVVERRAPPKQFTVITK